MKGKTDWEKEYEKLSESHESLHRECDEKWDSLDVGLFIVFWTIVALALFSLVLALFGVFDSPISKLDLDKDLLAKWHVIKYYPEYEDCNMKYSTCLNDYAFFCSEGVEIYCDTLENRDGLKVSTRTKPTEVLYFDGITLEDILINRINEK